MTTKRFPIYLDIINLILLYVIVMSLNMALSSGMEFIITPAEYAAIAFVLISSYLLKEYVNKMYLYIILHAVMVAVCILVPIETTGKVKLVFLAILFCIFDLYNWFNNRESMPDIHWGLGSMILFSFLVSTGVFEFGYSSGIFNMGIVFVSLLLVRTLLENFYDLSRSGQLTEEMPVRELFRNNSIIALSIIFLSIAFMVFVNTDALISGINRMIYNMFNKIWLFMLEHVFSESDESVSFSMNLLKPPDLPEAEENIFTQMFRILEAVITVLIVALLIYILIRILIGLVRLLMDDRDRRYRSHKSYKIKNEVRERLTRDDMGRRGRRSIVRSNAEKVRQIYRKELLSYKRSGADVKDTRTPRENGREVLNSKGHDISAATQIYEKVRYCVGYEATKQDVTQIKAGFRS